MPERKGGWRNGALKWGKLHSVIYRRGEESCRNKAPSGRNAIGRGVPQKKIELQNGKKIIGVRRHGENTVVMLFAKTAYVTQQACTITDHV